MLSARGGRKVFPLPSKGRRGGLPSHYLRRKGRQKRNREGGKGGENRKGE